jgi:hypothetical protein
LIIERTEKEREAGEERQVNEKERESFLDLGLVVVLLG